MTVPRGIRSNNPLNIDYQPANPWQGLDSPPSDGRFARFVAPQWGIRAAVKVLHSYQRRGIVTVRQTISTWAPTAENNTENYIGFVCRKAGVLPETRINLDDRDQVIAILKAMVLMECGPVPEGTANGNWLDDAVYIAGYSLARPITQSRTVRGSAVALTSAAAGAVVEMAKEVVPDAVDAASAILPFNGRFALIVLFLVCAAGATLAFLARTGAREEGIR
jgi:hypothetical protein